MEGHKEKNNASWMSVPQFGDWDQKGTLPDYSMDFTKIREMRKQNKRDVSRASLGNEEELFASTNANSNASAAHSNDHHQYQMSHEHATAAVHSHSPTARRSIFSYFNCCVKA